MSGEVITLEGPRTGLSAEALGVIFANAFGATRQWQERPAGLKGTEQESALELAALNARGKADFAPPDGHIFETWIRPEHIAVLLTVATDENNQQAPRQYPISLDGLHGRRLLGNRISFPATLPQAGELATAHLYVVDSAGQQPCEAYQPRLLIPNMDVLAKISIVPHPPDTAQELVLRGAGGILLSA
ncbi:MAG TPA: hypothetical protein VMR45_02700 [Patescibacteria group bacterium]|nr:hypothetical protein [Patescibacteria group bacterium]